MKRNTNGPSNVHGIRAKVIADSINPDLERLTTFEITFNRYILSELNTHRMLSKNSASSRAVPVSKIIHQVWSDPAVPVSWGANRPGMQASSELSGWRRRLARRLFLSARIPALAFAWTLAKMGLHKQVTNRILEPWMWHTAIISGTSWENFFKLRDHADAQPEFRVLAQRIRTAMDESVPTLLNWSDWHMPYTDDYDSIISHLLPLDYDDSIPIRAWISCARCARVSYVRQDEKREPVKDIEMMQRLKKSGHWSPFEHVAQAQRITAGNFSGWMQLRKFYPDESGCKEMT